MLVLTPIGNNYIEQYFSSIYISSVVTKCNGHLYSPGDLLVAFVCCL